MPTDGGRSELIMREGVRHKKKCGLAVACVHRKRIRRKPNLVGGEHQMYGVCRGRAAQFGAVVEQRDETLRVSERELLLRLLLNLRGSVIFCQRRRDWKEGEGGGRNHGRGGIARMQ